MICGEGSAVIERSAEEVLEFVLDLPRYAEADTKIRRIRRVDCHGTTGTVVHGGHLRGLPGPPVTLEFQLDPWSQLEFRSPTRGLGRFVFSFVGSFTCEATDAGTFVTHRECFEFRWPLRRVMEWYAGAWLAQDTRDEMARMKVILERGREGREGRERREGREPPSGGTGAALRRMTAIAARQPALARQALRVI